VHPESNGSRSGHFTGRAARARRTRLQRRLGGTRCGTPDEELAVNCGPAMRAGQSDDPLREGRDTQACGGESENVAERRLRTERACPRACSQSDRGDCLGRRTFLPAASRWLRLLMTAPDVGKLLLFRRSRRKCNRLFSGSTQTERARSDGALQSGHKHRDAQSARGALMHTVMWTFQSDCGHVRSSAHRDDPLRRTRTHIKEFRLDPTNIQLSRPDAVSLGSAIISGKSKAAASDSTRRLGRPM